MRKDLIALFIGLVALTSAFSGCFGKDSGEGATDTPGNDTNPSDPTPTDPTGGSPTPPGGNDTETPPPPKPSDVNETASVSAAGPQPTDSATFTVPAAGWASFEIIITPNQVAAPDGVKVSVTDSTDAEVATVTLQPGPPSQVQAPTPVSLTVPSGVEGEWTITASSGTLGSFDLAFQILVTY